MENNKHNLFKRMVSIGQMPINEKKENYIEKSINEAEVPSGDFVNDLQNLFYKYGYFITPEDRYVGLEIKKIDENEKEFNSLLDNIHDVWSKISLPW